MQVAEGETEEILTAVDRAVDGKVMQVKAVDITFIDADGEEIQPLAPIRVRMEPVSGTEINAAAESAKTSEGENFQVVHVDEAGVGAVVEQAENLTQEETVRVEEENAMVFHAEHFSVYALVYTVDFEYKGHQYKLPGGGLVTLSALMKELKITGESEADFLDRVDTVVFTNPELLWISKMQETMDGWSIVEQNQIHPVFSADVQPEELMQVYSTVVEAGDWVIISKQAFSTREMLTVTMSDGTVYEILVTDEKKKVEQPVFAAAQGSGTIGELPPAKASKSLKSNDDVPIP